MSFEKFLLCWDPIKSPINIYKFYLCIPTSLGTQFQTYVKKKKWFLENQEKGMQFG